MPEAWYRSLYLVSDHTPHPYFLTIFSKNGDSYEGGWHNDKEHGSGIYFYKKKKISGLWENGCLIENFDESVNPPITVEEEKTILFSQAEESDYLQL